MSVTIQLLGNFELRRDHTLVGLPARKTQALLAVLARRPGVPLAREWLAALLWPDVTLEQGRTSLRQALGHVRKALSNALLVSSLDQVYLDPSAASVDVVELERALDKPPLERERAAELYTGELLLNLVALTDPFADWLSAERLGLRQRVGDGLDACLAALRAACEFERAIAIGARLIALDPTRETAHCALMRLHLERGEPATALTVYERCRDSLLRKHGVLPGAALEALRKESLAPAAMRVGVGAGAPRLDARSPDSFCNRTVLAIAPFEALPDAGGARLLAAALSEDLATDLSRFRELAVVARASVASVLTRSTDARALANETGARLIVSGSVRVLDSDELGRESRGRVTASLRDTTTGLQLWAERWEVALGDLSGALDRLTRSISGALALSIEEVRLLQARRRPRERLEAYDCWLRGVECLRRGAPSFDDEARRFFEQALALEPTFARAHAGLSLVHFNDWSCQAWNRWDERERGAFEHAARAVELDDADPVTHCILGRIYLYRRDFARGESHLQRALALNQNDPEVLIQAGLGFTQLGDPQRGIALTGAALRLHPKHPDWYCAVAALPRFFARESAEAVKLAARAPDAFVDTRAILAAAACEQDLSVARDHAARFVRHFEAKIVAESSGPVPDPIGWLLHVNPLQRAEDAAYLRDCLGRAGLR